VYLEEYDISRVLYVPNRRIFGLLILMRNVPGVLAKVSDVFFRYNINILKVFATSNPDVADGVFFVDLTESNVSVDKLIKDLKNIKEVLDVREIEPVSDGLVVDYIHFPLILLDKRCVVLRQGVLEELIKGMRDEWGSAAEAFLYYAGLRIGKSTMRSHRYFSEDLIKRIRIFEQFFKNSGLGEIDIDIDIDRHEAEVKIKKSIECEIGRGALKPFSQFFRGIIAGVLSEVLGDVEVEEVECIAKGDKICRFIVRRKIKS